MDKEFCEMCCDATVCYDLNDDNDYSSSTLDFCKKMHCRLMFSSGWYFPPRLEVDVFDPVINQWIPSLSYFPNYCPNCGRKIDKSKYRFPTTKKD